MVGSSSGAAGAPCREVPADRACTFEPAIFQPGPLIKFGFRYTLQRPCEHLLAAGLALGSQVSGLWPKHHICGCCAPTGFYMHKYLPSQLHLTQLKPMAEKWLSLDIRLQRYRPLKKWCKKEQKCNLRRGPLVEKSNSRMAGKWQSLQIQ